MTRSWNSWFHTGARWDPAWEVSSSRLLRRIWPPRRSVHQGLLCQGSPHTGRLRASTSTTCHGTAQVLRHACGLAGKPQGLMLYTAHSVHDREPRTGRLHASTSATCQGAARVVAAGLATGALRASPAGEPTLRQHGQPA